MRALARSRRIRWHDFPELRIHVNPVHTWARFVTSCFLDEPTSLPADVLFYTHDRSIGAAYLQLEGQALLHELEDLQPCTIDEWVIFSRLGDRHELIEFSTDLAKLGLVAFG